MRLVPIGAVLTMIGVACGSDSAETSGKGGKGGQGGADGGAEAQAGTAGVGGVGGGGVGGIGGVGGTSGSGGMDASMDSMGGAAGDDAGPDASTDAPQTDAGDAAFDAPADVPADVTCGAGTKKCGGACVALSDPAFGCTATGCDPCNIPGAVASCLNDTCQLAACSPGFADCNGVLSDGCETDLSSDAGHCSACGNACVVANATAACTAGACGVGSCNAGFDDCDSNALNGCEADTQEDPNNCNTCNNVCTAGGGSSATCDMGSCGVMLCPIGLGDCDNNSLNGCETNLGLDPDNCGYCGRVCNLPNATATCSGVNCLVASCDPGFENCDGNDANGCETDVTTNSLHCGACNRACVTAGTSSTRCEAGTCFAICDAGTGDCVHPAAPAPDDGCETSTSADVDNCGACGNVCMAPTGTPVCNSGICSIGNCPGNTGDCDGVITNGCETDLDTTEDHCGACGRACSNDGVAVRNCASGICISACMPGLGNCDQPAAPAPDDGCEQDVSSDVNACGGCNRACATDNVLSVSCTDGKCDSTCQLGFGNCTQPAGGVPDDGCELQFNLASLNCGSCDNDCSVQGGGGSGLKCSSPITLNCGCAGNDGRCRTGGSGGTCDIGTLTCTCGGTACQPGEACKPGPGGDECQCNDAAPCAVGEVCCQSPAGCIDLMTDPASCGACGRECPPGFDCTAGDCACNGDASCDAGGGGTCTGTVCTCGATPCGVGQRCQPGGVCG